MNLLITKSEVEEYFQIALGRKESEFNNFIREAQMFHLKPLFRPLFWSTMMASLESESPEERFSRLLNEESYEYDSYTFIRPGLKEVLTQLTYGVYLLKSGFVDTSFGVVTKINPQSEPLEYKERRDWYSQHKSQANELFNEIVLFIERNDSDYDEWFEGFRNVNKPVKTRIINKDRGFGRPDGIDQHCNPFYIIR